MEDKPSDSTQQLPPEDRNAPIRIHGGLVAVCLALCLPWLLAGNHFRSLPGPGASVSALQPGSLRERQSLGRAGPWGRLEYTRIDLELPDEFVGLPDWAEQPLRWFFRARTRELALDAVASCGVPAATVERLRSQASWQTTTNGCAVIPDDATILELVGPVRYRLYTHLLGVPENVEPLTPLCYRPELIDERIATSDLSEPSIQLFRRLLYQGPGRLMLFSDLHTAVRQIQDPAERRRFIKCVSRRLSLLAKLVIDKDSNVEALTTYWGVGGHRKDLRSLIRSLKRVPGGCKIDVIHLLPGLMRSLLYHFPGAASSQPDCLWTTVNILSDSAVMWSPVTTSDMTRLLASDCEPVSRPSQLGDVVALTTRNGELVHVSTYVADEIVFTKNGANFMQPWLFMHLSDLIDVYTAQYIAAGPLKVAYYHRKTP